MEATEAVRMGQGLSDEDLRERVLGGDARYFEVLMRRHNQRLFRAARAILKSDDEAEDVMQEAYARAYAHLASFAGRSAFSTWLTRIAVHEALARLRRRRHESHGPGPDPDGDSDVFAGTPSLDADPEVSAHGGQLRTMLERAVDALPDSFREVFVLRAVQELSVAETAACLEIPEEMVKTRLFRARARLQEQLQSELDGGVADVFAFHLVRCDRIVDGAFARIQAAAASAAAAS